MKVPVQLQDPAPPLEGQSSPPIWWQSLQRIYQLVAKAINGNIEFGSPTAGPINVNGVWAIPVTPGAPNTDFTVIHNLGRVAVAYIVCAKNAACDVYTSPSANASPTTQLILRGTVAGVTLTLWIM